MAAKDYWRFRKIPWRNEEKFLAREGGGGAAQWVWMDLYCRQSGQPENPMVWWAGGSEPEIKL